MGLGAWAGARRSVGALTSAGPVLVLALTAVGVVLMRFSPALAGAGVGEAGTAWRGAWLWASAVVAPAVVGGWCFPVAAARLAPRDEAGQAYALESGGATVGGLVFTFLLAPLGSAGAVCVAAGVCGAAWLTMGNRRQLAALPLLAGIVLVGPADRALAHAGWRFSERLGSLADWRETRMERLELASGRPAALYADGRLAATFPDRYSTVARAHLMMLLHPNPARVAAVGALADGSVVTMLRHPVARLVAAEEDPGLAAVLPRWFGPPLTDALANPRLTVATGDPLRLIRSGGPWDLVVLADPDPTTLRTNRTRTVEFFRACERALAPGGVLVVRVGVSDTYLGGGGGRLLTVLFATLRAVFPAASAIPGEEVLLVAGRAAAGLAIDPATIAARWRERGIRDPDFDPDVLPLLVDPGRAGSLAEFLWSADAPANTAQHPRAVLLAAALHEARGAPPILTAARALEGCSPLPLVVCLVLVVTVLLICGARRVSLGISSGAVVGFASMGWWLLLLACWQATMGSVYGEVGALSAAFMAGTAVGAIGGRRWLVPSEKNLACVLAGGAAVSLAIGIGVPLSFPRAAIVPLLALGGGLTGAAFPSVAALAGGRSSARGVGWGFAADEAGAAFAALAVGLLIVPWAGIAAAGAVIAILEVGAAAALLLSTRRRRA
jgi:spermidine synthase